MQYDLWHYQVQLRRIAAHREKGAEAEIRKAYQDVLIELQAILGKYYAGYGDPETSILTRGDLQAAGQYKSFLEDVLSHLDGLGEPMERKIRKTVEDTYTTCYTGMAAAVQQVTAGNATLQSLFGGALAVTPETVRHIVEYPIPKLTLSTVFQRRRKQIVSDIQKTLAVGLASGDSYTKMAGRIAKTLGGNEKKARTIVRTEANRAISRGFQDVAEETAALLDGTGYVDVKTWRSMLDGDVRDTHRHLNGKTVHALEQFESKSGAKADCPGHFGVAEEDINCRCILVYSIMSEEEFVAQGGTLPKKSPKKEGQLQLITESDGTFRIKKADSDLTSIRQNGQFDYMARFTPKYSDRATFTSGGIKMNVKKVANSNFQLYTDVDADRKNKAVRLVEKTLFAVKKDLPDSFEIPKVAVIDFPKHNLNSNAIGGYDSKTGILYLNSVYDTTEKVLEFVTCRQGWFANTTINAPVLHELGHKFYEDCIKRLAISENISYNESKKKIDSRIFDYIEGQKNPLFIKSKLSLYAHEGWQSGKFTEIIAECFSARTKNAVAAEMIALLNWSDNL